MTGDRRPVVLVIDDDPVTRLMLEHMLRGNGYEPLTADSGAEGLPLAQSQQCDVVICDYLMPDETGLDLVIHFVDLGVPFVLLTGFAEADTLDDDRTAMVAAYLTKPVSTADLISVVDDLVPVGNPAG